MMLRSRNSNCTNIINNQKPGETKRTKKQTVIPGDNSFEPKAKRPALTDLSKAISNVIIDSSKKHHLTKDSRCSSRRSKSHSGSLLKSISESFESEELKSADESDPCPAYDFDIESGPDIANVAEFAFDIFKYYKSREKLFHVPDYLTQHPHLNKQTRAVLADWMVEVQETFELNHETLYMSVKILDLYLSKTEGVLKDDLQVLASAAIFIACKFEERSPPLIDDFMYVCDEQFTRDQMIQAEMKVLDVVNYDIGFPLSYRFVRRYARVTKTDMPKLTLARYILETSLMFYEFVGVSESLMAAAAILLAFKMHDKHAIWTPILHKYSGYKAEDVEPLMWELNHMMHKRQVIYDRLETVFSKYNHEVFFSVASIPLLPNIHTLDRAIHAPSISSAAL
ncbi:cyclin domain protein [Dictyocaulus viviparus]|uniref:Cyclin domain protein n=1 Tax=Dictyocaulus viviparus TaxID=29172 RepID=A0A0D8XTR9_DICVI|nr:cyclin domain protein [Dictyocaulus viviparus]